VYVAPGDIPVEDYDTFVEQIRDQTTTAFAQVRQQLRRNAKRNKRYYDISLKRKRFHISQWVLYCNPRKFRGKEIK